MNKSRTASLRTRIVKAYLTLALGGCLFFGVLAAFTVEGIEEFLVDDRLEEVAKWAAPRHAAGLPVEMPAGLQFHRGDEIPHELRGFPQGVREVYINGDELHVLTRRDALGEFVVVDHMSEYDKIEVIMYSMIGAGLLGFLLLSWFIGRYVAQRIVSPITTLAQAVREEDGNAPLPLLDHQDEMGDLARAFAVRTEALKQFLDRERFFTGDVSHELRTPLTVIIGAAEIIASQSGNQQVLQAAAERILRTATEAAESVNVLLLLARAPAMIDAPEIRVGELVMELAESHRHLIDGKPVELQCDLVQDFATHARRELLAAAVGNLLRNACQYTERGHVAIRVEYPIITVEDTGPGIPEIVRARLMREQPTLELAGSAGTGLGLALVARICEQLGIKLQVTSRPGSGTVFTLHLTAAPAI